MVLLYSARFSRRIVTRPGSRAASISDASIPRSTHAVTAFSSPASGRGSSSGGISPALELPNHLFPALGVAHHRFARVVALEVELPLLLCRVVTGGAVIGNERANDRIERP